LQLFVSNDIPDRRNVLHIIFVAFVPVLFQL